MTSARQVARALSAALLAATLLVAPGGAASAGPSVPTHPRTAEDSDTLPLYVSLSSLSPAVLPQRGTVTITGRLANTSSETWESVNLMPFISSTPITSRDELAQAAATDPRAVVGNRLTDPGTYARIGDLAPGARRSFRLRLPVSALGISGAPGVYWIGVHAFGADSAGRGLIGLARTFVPLVDNQLAHRRSTPVSVVLPVRDRVRRTPDGRLDRPDHWSKVTARGGRLDRIAGLGASAGDAPVSWLVDPAVLDAVQDFANGNPTLGLDSSPRSPTESPPASPSQNADDDPGENGGGDAGPPPPTDGAGSPGQGERASARALLERLVGELRRGELMSLGYADPDAVALARRHPPMLARARALAERRLEALNLVGTATVAPPDGSFDPDLLDRLPGIGIVLLTDRGQLTLPAASRLPGGQDLVLTDARAGAGGPGPTRPYSALALRQRLLSESYLELGSSSPRPVVLTLPPRWDPGGHWRAARLFETLRSTPWVRLAPLPHDPSVSFSGDLSYPRANQAAEVGEHNAAAARRLERTSAVVDHLLQDHTTVSDRLTGAAFGAVSWFARVRPKAAAAQVDALNASVRGRLDQVVIVGTNFVLLSGGSGTLTVALVNGLDQPVTVGVKADADPSVRLRIPDPVEVGPGQRTTMRIAVSSKAGLHEVTLHPVTVKGESAGRAFTFSMRTSQVSRLIWFILAGGIALLAVMIIRRIVLRIRHHRWRSEARAASAYEDPSQ